MTNEKELYDSLVYSTFVIAGLAVLVVVFVWYENVVLHFRQVVGLFLVFVGVGFQLRQNQKRINDWQRGRNV